MGDCKDQLQPNTTKEDKGSKLLGMLKSKKKEDTNTPDTFADLIAKADKKMVEMLAQKEADLRTEKGQEDKNRVALSKVRAAAWHLDEIIEIIASY
jgi:hypothetical protein